MSDIAYAEWKVKNEDQFHLFDINLYKNDIKNSAEIKIDFSFLQNNIAVKLNTNDFFITYLPSIYHFLDNSKFAFSGSQLYMNNNTKNFDMLFKYRKEIKQFKSNNFKFILKQELYIELNTYKYIQEKIKTWNKFGVSPNLNVCDFKDIYTLFNNIIIPYKIEGDNKYNNFSVLKLFVCTNFAKYFFKTNSKFKVEI